MSAKSFHVRAELSVSKLARVQRQTMRQILEIMRPTLPELSALVHCLSQKGTLESFIAVGEL